MSIFFSFQFFFFFAIFLVNILILEQFWIYRIIVERVQRVPYASRPVGLLLASYIPVVHFSQLMNRHFYIITNESPEFFFTFPQFLFPGVAFSVPGRYPEYHIAFNSYDSLGSSGLCSFSEFPYFWRPWQFWGVPVRYFLEYPSTRICPMFYIMIRLRLMGLGTKPAEITWAHRRTKCQVLKLTSSRCSQWFSCA